MYRLSSIPHRVKNIPEFLRNKLRWLDSNNVLIHIGKCGGSTVAKELKNIGYKMHEVHMKPAKFKSSKKYIITIRNPIARFISAFNYMHKLVIIQMMNDYRYESEKQLLLKYSTPTEIGEAIYDNSGKLMLDLNSMDYYISHIYEDIEFYIGSFLRDTNSRNINGVICTELLSQDMQRIFGVRTSLHERRNSGMPVYLSKKALSNLTQFLNKDFECITKLNEMGVLTSKQYEVLSDHSESRFCS